MKFLAISVAASVETVLLGKKDGHYILNSLASGPLGSRRLKFTFSEGRSMVPTPAG